jgi:hypothetical protein
LILTLSGAKRAVALPLAADGSIWRPAEAAPPHDLDIATSTSLALVRRAVSFKTTTHVRKDPQ